jgi:hypothetical protein
MSGRGKLIKRISIIVAILLILGIICGGALLFWKAKVKAQQEARAFEATVELIEEGNYGAALQVITSIERRNRDLKPERREEWTALKIEAFAKSRRISELLALRQIRPDLFLPETGDEEAAYWVARFMLHGSDLESFEEIVSAWTKAEGKRPDWWFLLRADELLLGGEREAAREFLMSREFEGELDLGRLTRLSLMTARIDLAMGWGYLNLAMDIDSRNPDVRSFRAQILESIGKAEAARVEYVAATLAEPNNVLLRDQLAEFYRRQDQLGVAQQTWMEVVDPVDGASADFIWMKSWFWDRFYRQAADLKLDADAAPAGPNARFLKDMLQLSADRFWNREGERIINEPAKFKARRQEGVWMEAMQKLLDGQEIEARQALLFNPHRGNSWNREMEDGLLRVLSYRELGVLNPPERVIPAATPAARQARHQVWNALEDEGARMSREGADVFTAAGHEFWMSSWAVPSLWMAGGWFEAGIRLKPEEPMPASAPDWVAYTWAQGFRLARGPEAALEFLASCPDRADLRLVKAETLAQGGDPDASLELLTTLVNETKGIGFRAATLVATAKLDQKDWDGVDATVLSREDLATSDTGMSLRARAAIGRGELDSAEKIYEVMSQGSLEAMAFLARRAYERQAWSRARELTEIMMRNAPDQMQLRANLKAIDDAEKAGSQQ